VRGASKGWWKRGGEGVEEEGRGGENDEVKSNQFQTNEVNRTMIDPPRRMRVILTTNQM